MGRVSTDHDFHAKRKKATAELLKGKELAAQLQAHLHESDGSARQLALQISRSFADALSTLSSSAEPLADRKKSPPGAKDRRGCYKRRRSLDSWVTVSSTKDDGFAWRKYGQKEIMSSKHPRCYYRCSHKPDGCKATKQVQRMKEDPTVYQTTYFNHHSCKEMLSSQLLVQEVKENGGQSDQDVSSNEANSTLEVQWDDVDTGLESLGYKPEWSSSGLHGLDMEVNELGDIDYSVF